MNRKNDFFEYSIERNKWMQINTEDIPPTPRDRHVSIVHKDSIFVFGGYDGFNRVNDFFEYNILQNSWQEVLCSGRSAPPSPRHSHSAVIYNDSLYIFGGYDGKYKNDFFKFDFNKNEWSEIFETLD
jgi:leucine-zipper-like transcriptional regulator 1